ncbi:MAG: isoprenylcysteine carboxylmethyltransferase family protein [Chromatiales bacterium]|nr:isoprenylcysteine carboxylmethyltransferase family protein [Chromatiales bacterium]
MTEPSCACTRLRLDGSGTQIAGEDHANVHFPPPLIHGVGVMSGLGLSYLYPLVLPKSSSLVWVGAGLLALALAIASSAFREFARSRNPVPPNRPIHGLMTAGPFRFTRNPLYLALACLHAGFGLVAGNAWVLLILVPSLLWVRYYVIVREEAYLTRRFGQPYLDYQAQVRRWI